MNETDVTVSSKVLDYFSIYSQKGYLMVAASRQKGIPELHKSWSYERELFETDPGG